MSNDRGIPSESTRARRLATAAEVERRPCCGDLCGAKLNRTQLRDANFRFATNTVRTTVRTPLMLPKTSKLRGKPTMNPNPGKSPAVRADFNAAFLNEDRPEQIFSHHLKRLGIIRTLDIGSNSGQFAAKLRTYGYEGVIYSVEPQRSAYAQLVRQAKSDMRWIPLARQGAGSEKGFVDLNISENNWSSSVLEVHPNHLRAEMATRIVGTESIYINKSSELLGPQILAEVEALKIDVQGFEEQVIRGYLPFMSKIRLLLLELSLVECYRGAPDLFALDQYLVNDLSFSRVSLEPSYYDDVLGVVQQYDGIYYKPDKAPCSQVPLGLGGVTLVTSIGRTITRKSKNGEEIGREWLDVCSQSWARLSSDVCSVSETAPPDNSITWLRTRTRPSIAEIFRAVSQKSGNHVVLINGDIALTEEFNRILPTLDPSTIYYGSRLDAEATVAPNKSLDLAGLTYYRWGFDFFVLTPGFVSLVNEERLIPEEFRIGEPWWDYLLPVLAMAYGFPIKNFRSQNYAVHLKHDMSYSPDVWLKNGQRFVASVLKMKEDSRCTTTGVLSDVVEVDGSIEEQLGRICNNICLDLP